MQRRRQRSLEIGDPGIEKGIPTYIDKPLANSVEDVRKIQALARRHNVRSFYHCSMHISAYGPQGAIIDSKNINDFMFPYGAAEILRLIRRMMETGKADDSMDEMIEAVAAINAGRLSVRDGGRSVSLQEVDPQ